MTTEASPEFQRAFVAMSYMVGRRESELLAPLRAAHEEARTVVRLLAHPERERRAEVLARELGRLVFSLDARTCK